MAWTRLLFPGMLYTWKQPATKLGSKEEEEISHPFVIEEVVVDRCSSELLLVTDSYVKCTVGTEKPLKTVPVSVVETENKHWGLSTTCLTASRASF